MILKNGIKKLLLILIIVCFYSCNKISKPVKNIEKNKYTETILPSDTTSLWVGKAETIKDTVLIVGEGGPKNSLDYESSGRVYWEYLDSFNNYHTVVVHQSSTYNNTIFGADNFDLKGAKKEVDNSSEMLYRAIKYFKDRNKYVVVFGHSYSGFIIPHYLSTRPSLADKYIITGGRINADSTQTAYQLKYINTGFNEDGKTLNIVDENKKPKKHRTKRYFIIRKNKELLKYAIGFYKYSEMLKDKNLSNLVFYYGKKDQNVGALTDDEINFLTSKGAEVRGVDTNHYRIWQRVIDSINAKKIKLY